MGGVKWSGAREDGSPRIKLHSHNCLPPRAPGLPPPDLHYLNRGAEVNKLKNLIKWNSSNKSNRGERGPEERRGPGIK